MSHRRGTREEQTEHTNSRSAEAAVENHSPAKAPGKISLTKRSPQPANARSAVQRRPSAGLAGSENVEHQGSMRSDAGWMTDPFMAAALLGTPLPETPTPAQSGSTNDAGSAVDAGAAGVAFLRSLRRESIEITPMPVIIGSNGANIDISLRGTPPPNKPVPRIHWQLFRGEQAEPVAQGDHVWPLQESTPLWFADAYHLICEVQMEGIGSRILTRRFTARDDTLDSARALSDDELLGEQKALRSRLATETDPASHGELQTSYENAQWIAHERGIQSHEDWARKMDMAQGRHALPEDAEGMRAYVEHLIAIHGRGWGMLMVSLALGADEVTPEQRALGKQQLSLVLGEADALEAEFERRAMRTVWQLLDQSSRQIGDILRGYGLSLAVDDLVLQLARNDDADVDSIAEQILARSKRDVARPEGTYLSKTDERVQLSAVAAELHAQQEHLHDLYAERLSLMQQRDEARPIAFDAAREHPSHHEQRDPLRDPRVLDLVGRIDPGLLASHSPELAGLVERSRQSALSGGRMPGHSDPEKVAQLDLWLAATDADIKRAQIAYKTRWLEAERAHPILVAYREKPGQESDLSSLIRDDDDDLMLGVLRDVLPKLANIAKAGTWLKSGHLDPLELPPVVDLAKKSLLIVPGSMRDRVVDEMVENARDDWKEWAIAAVTLGLAVLTAVPSGGSSVVLLAEFGGLALDAYLSMETYADFTIQSAIADTSIDPTQALANEEPSLTWLAVQLMATGLGAAFAVKTFREAVHLRRAAEAGESAQAALRHLDEVGEQHGLGKIGSRIVEGADDQVDIAHRAIRPGLYSDRVGQYAAENADGLARRLGTGVEVDPGLGSGVRIDRFVHDDGDVWLIGLRVGPDATTADVLAHGKTIELMCRYNGTIGDLRAVIERGLGKAVHEPGSMQEIASLEVEKLGRLIRERQRALAAMPVDSAAAALEQEIAFLRQELAEWEAKLLSSEPGKVVSGVGEIGSPDIGRGKRTTKIKRATSLTEERAVAEGGLGVPQGFNEARFEWLSTKIRSGAGHLGDDISVHGSRASGTAKAASDIDIAIRVTPERFNELIEACFGRPNPSSAKERTMLHAIATGKIQAGEAGLRGLRRALEKEMKIPVDISVIQIGGEFDVGPFIPLR